jgi:DNA-directed RNA polymerase subunit RPC12/RpoP
MKGPIRSETEGFAFHCLRCGHHWNSQNGKRPVACAHCCSAYWDRPRVKDSVGTPPVPQTPSAHGDVVASKRDEVRARFEIPMPRFKGGGG